MKLIALNTWGGRVHQPLIEFIKTHALDTDIFCLHEVFSSSVLEHSRNGTKANLLEDLKDVLPGYNVFYAPKSIGYDYAGAVDADISFGNVIFIKDTFNVTSHEETVGIIDHPNHDWTQSAIGKAQFLTFIHEGKDFVVCNLHGLWQAGSNKADNLERIQQSEEIRKHLDSYPGAKIVCGDFNLLPDGESIKILEQEMRNLIKEYNITSTRSSFYTKDGKYADYALVSEDITVKDFKVLPDEVSDHLALMLEFE